MKNKSVIIKGILFISFLFSLASCRKDIEPPLEENEVEEFTYIEFLFTNTADASDVRKAIWIDADGFGPGEPVVTQNPVLAPNTTYELTFVMENRLVSPAFNLLGEIEDEKDEHQIFFEFTAGFFTSPTGSGNIQDRNGAINYLDTDNNGLPIGLRTLWTTGDNLTNGTMRILLGHQPGVKTSTSTWDSGDIDWDITLNLSIR
jgi:hypothetical protein